MADYHDTTEMIELYKEFRKTYMEFYARYIQMTPNAIIDLREVMVKMDVMDLYVAGDFKSLWLLERCKEKICASKVRLTMAAQKINNAVQTINSVESAVGLTPIISIEEGTKGLTYFK
jgi:hypothetical protein